MTPEEIRKKLDDPTTDMNALLKEIVNTPEAFMDLLESRKNLIAMQAEAGHLASTLRKISNDKTRMDAFGKELGTMLALLIMKYRVTPLDALGVIANIFCEMLLMTKLIENLDNEIEEASK